MSDEPNNEAFGTTSDDPEVQEQLRIGIEIMKKYADTLRALAQDSSEEEKPE